MKIPKTVKIGWRNYTVKLIEYLKDDNDEPLYGETDCTNHVIWINKSLPEDEQKVIFLHEVFHAIFHSQSRIDWRDDEDLVNASAEGIFQLFKDNPKIFEG